MIEPVVIGDATLYCGKSEHVLPTLADNSVDSIVTDPPYGIGFMGKSWDIGVPAVELFEECLRVLKPGGHLLAFGGARTYHRLAVAVEDAGFTIRDQIMWIFGSGFPKSRDIGRDLDEWDGWGTALKPAHEPILVARKPFAGTVADNVQRHGTGAINIDGCRVSIAEDGEDPRLGGKGKWNIKRTRNDHHTVSLPPATLKSHPIGRWPANVIHDGSDEVVELFPAKAGAFAPVKGTEPSRPAKNAYGEYKRGGGAFHGDAGSAARFFYCAKASRADRNEGCELLDEKPLLWSSGTKSPGTFQVDGTKRAATNNHPTVKPTALMRYLCRLVTPPGGVVLDPFMGSGSTGKAALQEGFGFIGVDKDEAGFPIAVARVTRAQRQGKLAI